MAQVNKLISDKEYLTLGVLGPVDSGKTLLTAAISKTLQLQQAQYEAKGIITRPDYLLIPNCYRSDVALAFETPSHIYTILSDPSWNSKYQDFVIERAKEMAGAILVIYAFDNWEPLFRQHLEFIHNLNIMKLVIFLSKTDFVWVHSNLALIEQQIRTILTAYRFTNNSIPIVSGSAFLALDSPNTDPTAPEYKPIIKVIQALEEIFDKQC